MTALNFQRRPVRPAVAAFVAGRHWLAHEASAALGETAAASAGPDDEEACAARGWYDSSWDLRCGLEVCEDLPLDAWFGAAAN